jgi:hypothetical protein
MRFGKQMGTEFFSIVFGVVAAGVWVATGQVAAGAGVIIGFGFAALAWLWRNDSTYRLHAAAALTKRYLGVWYWRLINLTIAVIMTVPFLLAGGEHLRLGNVLLLAAFFYAALVFLQWQRRHRRRHTHLDR